MSISEWLDKQIVVYPYSGILLNNGNKPVAVILTPWMNLKICRVKEDRYKRVYTVYFHLYKICVYLLTGSHYCPGPSQTPGFKQSFHFSLRSCWDYRQKLLQPAHLYKILGKKPIVTESKSYVLNLGPGIDRKMIAKEYREVEAAVTNDYATALQPQ